MEQLSSMEIGIDIIRIKRFKLLIKGDLKYWGHVFTRQEWEYAFKKSGTAVHLAGIFAAKEAALKATGTKNKTPVSFELFHKKSGKPFFKNLRLKVSISHDGEYAMAVALHI